MEDKLVESAKLVGKVSRAICMFVANATEEEQRLPAVQFINNRDYLLAEAAIEATEITRLSEQNRVLREAARHALTFIENRFSDLSPEKRSTVAHLSQALATQEDGNG